MTYREYMKPYRVQIRKELAEAVEDTGLSVEDILRNYELNIDELAEAMDQTGLTANEILARCEECMILPQQ